jgi:hypothetical protein
VLAVRGNLIEQVLKLSVPRQRESTNRLHDHIPVEAVHDGRLLVVAVRLAERTRWLAEGRFRRRDPRLIILMLSRRLKSNLAASVTTEVVVLMVAQQVPDAMPLSGAGQIRWP